MPSLHLSSSKLTLIGVTALLLLPACSVNVKKNEDGQEKNVDIRTPVGDLHVDKNADARDTGLPVYPGARPKHKEDNDEEKNANVNLSFGPYGLKVVAIEYESDDAPEKIISFYQTQLKKYGNVVECHVHKRGGHVQVTHHSDSKFLSCEDSGGTTVELKVGTDENQHIVSVDTQDKGSSFALVRVQTHGKDTI